VSQASVTQQGSLAKPSSHGPARVNLAWPSKAKTSPARPGTCETASSTLSPACPFQGVASPCTMRRARCAPARTRSWSSTPRSAKRRPVQYVIGQGERRLSRVRLTARPCFALRRCGNATFQASYSTFSETDCESGVRALHGQRKREGERTGNSRAEASAAPARAANVRIAASYGGTGSVAVFCV
jgi:hypothetical protein